MKHFDRIAVLTDYTVASGIAAAHAYQLAATSGAAVVSLHGIESEKDKQWAESKSAEQLAQLANYDAHIPHTALTTTSNLFNALGSWLEQEHIGLYFMATHGKKDLQFITGSNALKLIFNAAAPMIVVQRSTQVTPFAHIVMPVFGEHAHLDFPIDALHFVVKAYHSKVTLLTLPGETAHKAVDRIQAAIEKDAHSIEVMPALKDVKKWEKEVMEHARALQADALAVVVASKHHRTEAEKHKKSIQHLITNEYGLPVLCL